LAICCNIKGCDGEPDEDVAGLLVGELAVAWLVTAPSTAENDDAPELPVESLPELPFCD
jgi:hypothetical protein